jgi:hypothetical protein
MDDKKLGAFIDAVLSLFKTDKTKAIKKAEDLVTENISKPVEPILVQDKVYKWDEIDWTNPSARIAKYFTVKDALWLREWNRLATAQDGLNDTVKKNLVDVFAKMDLIREFLGVPVFIKSAYRPSAYNVAIGGATFSAHMANVEFAAVDFWCDEDGDGDKDGDDCDLIKEKLRPKLAEWNIRMEINGKGARWVHIDTKPVPASGHREFNP